MFNYIQSYNRMRNVFNVKKKILYFLIALCVTGVPLLTALGVRQSTVQVK